MTTDPPTNGRSDEETLPLSAGARAPGTAGAPSPFAAHAVATERPGDEVGPYKLVSLLGEGGFGAVWLAERRQPFVQQVALKLVKAGMDSKAVVARFEQERQAMAVMNHPNIAKVLDGGLTAAGRPYFAMEYVKGEPINRYCDGRKLPIADRLRLFTQVCDAVQHAHTKGLIHRDLKPGNVLVATGDGDQPRVKVIDFGVAKALTQRLTEHTVFTETGQMIGTPEYMSPEQAEPDANDIDTRTDVYALGVILYELLTGTLPFEAKELRSKAYREIQRIIREVDPPTPSTRLSTIVSRDTAAMGAIAAARRARVDELTKQLRNELEWIPLKAMRKEREQRYGSAHELAADVRNYLDGKPLVAAPESAAYRLRKFVRRNRALALGTSAVAAALLAGAVVSTMFGVRELQARRQAESRERELQRVLAFQSRQLSEFGGGDAGTVMAAELVRQFENALLREVDPAQRQARAKAFRAQLGDINLTDVASALVRKVMLQRAAGWAARDFAAEPVVQAGLFMAIGRSHGQLGDTEAAHALFVQARDILQANAGPGDRRTMDAREWAARTGKDLAADETELRALLADRTAAFGADDPDVLQSRRALADALMAKGDYAAALAEQQAVAQALAGATDPALVQQRVDAVATAGELHRLRGELDAAERDLSDARRQVEALQPVPDRLHSHVLTNLGLALTEMQDAGKRAAGLELLRKAADLDAAFHGETHPLSFASRLNLASTLMKLDDGSGAGRAQAMEVLERSRDVGTSLVQPPMEHLLSSMELAVLQSQMLPADEAAAKARLAQAIATGESALAAMKQRGAADTDQLRALQKAQAWMYLAYGRAAEAEALLRDVRGRWLKVAESKSIQVLDVGADLADAIAAQGRLADAAAVLAGAQDAAKQRDATSDARWNVAVKYRDLLKRMQAADPDGPARAQLIAQQAVVDELRKARVNAKLPVDADKGG